MTPLHALAGGCALFWICVGIENYAGVPLLSLVGIIPAVTP
jgi:hypothetical protein